MSKCSLLYRLYEQERTSLNAIAHSPSYANVTSSCPALSQPSWFSMYPFHKSLRDKKFRPRIGKLQWRPKWMKRYSKSSSPTSFCRLLRLLLFYKFVDFILSESPLKLLFNQWYQAQVKYFRINFFQPWRNLWIAWLVFSRYEVKIRIPI